MTEVELNEMGTRDGIAVHDAAEAARIGRTYACAGRVVFIVNEDKFFLTHRASWGVALQSAGASVHVVAADTGYAEQIEELGFKFHPMHLGRDRIRPLDGIKTTLRMVRLLNRLQPSAVFLVGTAAYTLGWPASLWLRGTRFVVCVTGAGRALEPGSNGRLGIAGRIVVVGLAACSRLRNVVSLYQTEADASRFAALGVSADRAAIVRGTGIDVGQWKPGGSGPEADDPPVVMFASRLIQEKGVFHFVEIAERMQDWPARFVIVGEPDPGASTSVPVDVVENWRAGGHVEIWGPSRDMVKTLRHAALLVFPTRHPEGTPRILIEAGAVSVPVVTSSMPGCLEVVVDGETGVVVQSDDVGVWISRISHLLADREMLRGMGETARLHIGRKFGLEAVLHEILVLAGAMKE